VTRKQIERIFEKIGFASDKERECFFKMIEQFNFKDTESKQTFIRITANTKEKDDTLNA